MSVASMASSRRYPTATRLPSGNVLIVGGQDTSVLTTTERYRPISKKFVPSGQLGNPRLRHTATYLGKGKVLIVGGCDAQRIPYASSEIYDSVKGSFSTTGSMSIPRWRHTETLLPNGNVLIVGGSDGSANATNALSSAEIYINPFH
jgi:hypothetical protein